MDKGKYQVMPDLTPAEYEELKADIAARGVQVAVELDEDGDVLDGHHRVRACSELGIAEYPTVTRCGMTDAEKRTHARALNMARRHLTAEQKREAIKMQLLETPEKSNVSMAKQLGVSDKTVGRQRAKMEATSEIPRLDKTIGADGKTRKRPEGRGEIPHIDNAIDTLGRKQPRKKTSQPKTNPASLDSAGMSGSDFAPVEPPPPKTPPTHKVCTKCGEEKPVEEYYKGSGQCKDCRREIARSKKKFYDYRGKPIEIPPEIEEIASRMSFTGGTGKANADDAIHELELVVETYSDTFTSTLSRHSELLAGGEHNGRILAVLGQADAATDKIRKELKQ